MLRPKVLFLTLLVFSGAAICQGQVTVTPIVNTPAPPPPTEQPTKLDPETEKKALDLVETLADQVVNLHAPANRIHAEFQVADLLWPRDEKRARNLLTAAVSQLASQISDLDYSDPEVYNEITRLSALRQDLLMRIARHDGDMAIDALNRTRFQGDNRSRYGNAMASSEANLELTLARVIAATNPEAALKLARSSLSRGVSISLIQFLPALYQKDAKAAQSLYQEIVARIKNDDVARNPELASNAWGLLISFQPPQADEDTYRDLLTSMLSYLFSLNHQTQPDGNAAHNMFLATDRIMPLVEKYAPARATELREWSRGIEKNLDPNARMYEEIRSLTDKGSVDDLLGLAAKYPPEFQSLIYQSAAWKAVSNGDTARGKEIAEKISDPVQRRQVMDQLDNLATRKAEGDNKIVEARRLSEKATSIARKIDILLQAATSLAATDKKAALDLLSEAKSVLASATQSGAELNAQLQLAQAYLRLDPDQAFGVLQPLLVRTNEMVAAAVVLDGVDYRYLRDGEWLMQGGNALSNLILSLNRVLSTLGRVDFDRARTLADQISRPEMRVMMEIDLVQTTLGGGPNPNQMIINGRIVMPQNYDLRVPE